MISLALVAGLSACAVEDDELVDDERAGGWDEFPPGAVICPAIYGPVCGDDGTTYVNQCWLEAAGAELLFTGICSDFDGDWCVGFADFLILSENYDQRGEHPDGDADGDGMIQFPDFLILSSEWEPYSCNP